jgi:tetratricopeptide (TPR) repeat protein
MNAYGTGNDPMAAQELYDEMKRKGVTPHLFTYGVMLKVWGMSSLPEALQRAEAIYQDLAADEKAEVGVWHTNALMNIYANFGRVEKAKECLEAIAKTIVPQQVHYNTVLKACARSDNQSIDVLAEAAQLVQTMRDRLQRPDVVTYTTLLQIYRRNDVAYAISRTLVEGMMKLAASGETSAAPTVQTWMALLDYWRTGTSRPHDTELDWIERVCNHEAVQHSVSRLRQAGRI